MIIKEAIILAGGLGTRLRSAIPDLPKCMAPVNGKPFIAHVTAWLQQQGIEKFIFALGYKHQDFDAFMQQYLHPDSYQLSIEVEPLGTGGAILLAGSKVKGQHALVANGDTLFKVDASQLSGFHLANQAHCTLSLKPMLNFDRYGVVQLDENQHIKCFKEKQFFAEGLINGGVYALDMHRFKQEELPQKFSFEKDYLEQYYNQRNMYGLVQEGYFIDIGIPEDYLKAQQELV